MSLFRVYGAIDELYTAIGEALLAIIDSTLAKKGRVSLALTGGNTPIGIFRYLQGHRMRFDGWADVSVFWVDERVLPPESHLSNFGQAYRTLFMGISRVRLFPIDCRGGGEQGALAYERVLLQEFGGMPEFDCVLLGVGPDGHIASLFDDREDFGKHWVVSTVAPDGLARVSMTPVLLNKASSVLLVATGAEKGRIINSHIRGCTGGLGISLLKTKPDVYYLDAMAAAEISMLS